MKTLKYAMAAGVMGGLSAMSMPATAAVTGGVAATSEYVFRGIDSEDGAAIHGNLDWLHDSGVYAGIWGSNTNLSGGNELDLILGYGMDLNETVSVDGGLIYYIFSEDEEQTVAGDTDIDYLELYLGINIRDFSFYAYYTDNLFAVEDNDVFFAGGADDGESIYLSADYSIALNSVASLGLHVGTQIGDGADAVYGMPDLTATGAEGDDGEYVDYGISLNVDMGNDWSSSFAIIDTTLDEDSGLFGDSDDPKFVVTFAKAFAVAD